MPETKQISATIDLEVANKVAELADREDRTFSKMIEILLKRAFVTLPKPKAKKQNG